MMQSRLFNGDLDWQNNSLGIATSPAETELITLNGISTEVDKPNLSQLWLFGYYEIEHDLIEERFLCWKMIAGVALAREFVVCENPNEGWEFRPLPLVV